MTAVTVHTANLALGATSDAGRRGLLARLWAGFVRARMRQAEREIALHQHLLPQQLEALGAGLDSRSEKDLPFVR